MIKCEPDQGSAMERSSSRSDVTRVDDRVLETVARVGVPPVHNLNVTKSSRVHIGPKFVSVTQNVDNTEVVKGRILGLELVSPKNSRRLRCSVAVFVCWALVVACALSFVIFHFALAKQDRRLDIDLPLPGYLWNVVKNTTKAERLSCAVALSFLIACIIIIVYFIVFPRNTEDAGTDEGAPHEWYITRAMWLAPTFSSLSTTMDEFEPLGLVVISHTVSTECYRFIDCAAEMRNLQLWFERTYDDDIPYNFVIGNEGRVYESRGWNVVGATVSGYNNCTLNVAFIGDYRESRQSSIRVKKIQLERLNMLLEQGIDMGHLHPQFKVLGARDLKATISPGDKLYDVIQQWHNFAHDNVFKGRSCQEIHAMFDRNTTTVSTLPTDVE